MGANDDEPAAAAPMFEPPAFMAIRLVGAVAAAAGERSSGHTT